MSEQVVVECYSGYVYAQEPTAFTWGDRRYVVAKVEWRWRTPTGPWFRVRTTGGERFDLSYDAARDTWRVVRCSITME